MDYKTDQQLSLWSVQMIMDFLLGNRENNYLMVVRIMMITDDLIESLVT